MTPERTINGRWNEIQNANEKEMIEEKRIFKTKFGVDLPEAKADFVRIILDANKKEMDAFRRQCGMAV